MDGMKSALLMASACTGLLMAQIPVPPGLGTLAKAITEAAPGSVLQLEEGGEYTHATRTLGVIGKPITIQGKPGSSRKAVIRLAANADTGASYHYLMVKDGASITLRGLDVSGMSGNVIVARTLMNLDGLPDPTKSRIGTIRVEDCFFHDFKDNIFHGMRDTSARGLHQDSLFVDNVIVYNADGFIQYKHISLHYLKMTRTTAYNLGTMALKIGKVGYRSTLISPTGLIDHCTLDNMGGKHGHIQVDDAYHPLEIRNSIISNIHDTTIQPPVYFRIPHIEAAVTLASVCFWKTDSTTASPTAPFWPGYVFKDTVTRDPGYRDRVNGDFTLPAGSPLRTFGTDGGPIGDPRWADGSVSTGRPSRQTARRLPLVPGSGNGPDYDISGSRLEAGKNPAGVSPSVRKVVLRRVRK